LKYQTISLLIASFSVGPATAQNPQELHDTIGINIHNKDYVYTAKKMKGSITLDGMLDEPDWQTANIADNFHLVQPVDTGFPKQKSEVMLVYDDKALYVAVIFHDTIPGKRIFESFRRDYVFNNNDNFLSIFDTFRDQTNGYTFEFSASGAISDGIRSGETKNSEWDSKVELKLKNYPDKWVTEMKIPFKSIRYPANSQTWYTNFGRLDLKANEKSAWAPVPRQFPHSSLAYTGVLHFEEPLPKPKMNFSLIPYLYGGYHRNFEAGEEAGYRRDFGMDAKIGLSTAMNLDLTYNPDFAQVEVDQQVMNIDRFELFYPEKRQFFLENSDLFANYGNEKLTPFFSRRIGLDAPVLGGARLSGKLNNTLRLGFINMTTEKTAEHAVRNYTVLSLQKKVLARSNISFMFVNKEYASKPAGVSQYNRVAALDFNLASKNNEWLGKAFYHRSFQPGNPDKQYAQGTSVRYSKGNILVSLDQAAVGENYLAETGYVRRSNYISFSPELSYFFIPRKKVTIHGPFVKYRHYATHAFQKLDHELDAGYKVEFSDRSVFAAGMRNYYIRLMQDFDPTHVSSTFLPAGNEYSYSDVYTTFTSNNRQPFNTIVTLAKGGFYNGSYDMIDTKMVYRFQPYVNFSMNVTYTNLRLPQPFEYQRFWLIGPKLDITFTDKLFLTTFMQYNEQRNNTNVNIRFQWRYKPVSDLFIVYTDNYFANTREVRNRALIFKLTYWWN